MRPLRIEGSPDAGRVVQAAAELITHLKQYRIVTEGYVTISRDTDRVTGAYDRHFESLIPSDRRTDDLIRHPDIMILDRTRVRGIVELDGSIHDTRPGRKKTGRRNKTYEAAGIPLIAINEADQKATGVDWRVTLIQECSRLVR